MKFRKGNFVVINDDGAIYTTYDEMARWLGAKKWKWGKENDAKLGEIGIIRGGKPHSPGSNTIIYLVDLGKREILIGERGLKLIANEFSLTKKILFKLQL